MRRALLVALAAIAMAAGLASAPSVISHVSPVSSAAARHTFAALVQQLSEPGGDFDTDNLISNERSFLHVMPALRADGVTGGAYIGVGPDQNFSYIAQIRPSIAFIVDIRRDNLLLHLLFKSLIARSRNRLEFLCLLTARAVPADVAAWTEKPLQDIVSYVDGARAEGVTPDLRRSVEADLKNFGVPLTAADLATVARFHQTFAGAGLSLQFESRGRPPRPYYPTYRQLILETDRTGRAASYLAAESSFDVVKSLEAKDAIVPVVGDLSGPHAVRAIGQLLESRHERLSAFYVSNVERYLFRDDAFPRYIANLEHLPRDPKSLVIRSVFDGMRLPETVPGYYSTSTVQRLDQLIAGFEAGRYKTYWDLVDSR